MQVERLTKNRQGKRVRSKQAEGEFAFGCARLPAALRQNCIAKYFLLLLSVTLGKPIFEILISLQYRRFFAEVPGMF